MKAAIIGYGKMGREIGKILAERGHEVTLVIDQENVADLDAAHLAQVDVALEFTTPATAYDNIRTCLEAGTPVVSGTTGWTDRLGELQELCRARGGALFYASNYCLGVNLMFRITRRLAELACGVGSYDVSIEEVHHIHKKDAPSGTAITLAEQLLAGMPDKTGWASGDRAPQGCIPIRSLREGEVPGIHTVTFDAGDEKLEIRHTIKNRRTLALGAVTAAEFLCGRRGVYTMDDLLK